MPGKRRSSRPSPTPPRPIPLCRSQIVPSLLSRIDRAQNEFMGALVNLKRAPLNTPSISAKLEEVEQQWLWLESSLDISKETYYPLIVVDASEKILVLMDAITAMYARLSRES